MFSSTYNNASGYELKPGAQLVALSSPIKRQQISDAQLKILPAFGYAGKQAQFADSLKELFLTWRLVFLVKNVPVISQKNQYDGRSAQVMTTPANTYFSPREQRGRVGPGVWGSDLVPDPSMA